MQITVRGKNIKVTEPLRAYVEKRLTKLDKYFSNFGEALVTLSVERENHRIEVTIPVNGMILRGEEATHDMYAAVDMVVEKLEKQVDRYKARWNRRVRSSGAAVAEAVSGTDRGEFGDENSVARVKRFTMKPMNIDEAIMQMNLLGHSFFMFMNAETELVNVLYRRKDGNFGLIEPEI
jgi:putative sigma-54 modulation protein